MITAHFFVAGEEREVRQVEADWLESAQKNQDNVLLTDGNTYRIQNVQTTGDSHARVELVAPQFSRGS